MDNKTPDNKQEFKWTSELVSECVQFCYNINKTGTTQAEYWGKDLVQEFIKSKEHKVEEGANARLCESEIEEDGSYARFTIEGPISKEKYEAVKQAIERELNNDTVVEDNYGYTLAEYWNNEYTKLKSEVDAIRKETWEAARLTHSFAGMKYDTIENYLNHLSNIGELNTNEPLSDSIPTLERQYYVPLAEGGKCPKIPLTPPQESKQDSKGYEIITMRLRNNIMPYILNTVFSEPWEINSVRRLSDGEVFSVGEEVSTNRNRGKHKIDAFSIIDGDMCVVMSTFPTGNEFLYVISKLPPPLTEQPKQVLFTTEDGVEVHYNDNCWIVENGNDMPFQWIKCCKEGMSEKYKYFSTKEAAVQYILDNKPCLSLKEVKDYWSKHYCGDFMVADFAENITALAKNKIKNTTPLNKEHK